MNLEGQIENLAALFYSVIFEIDKLTVFRKYVENNHFLYRDYFVFFFSK